MIEMVDKNAEILLDFVQNNVMQCRAGALEIGALPAEWQPLGEELNRLAAWMQEYERFAAGLSQGELATVSASRENRICWPLKELRSNLAHLTWQTRQVAKGDYGQRVDFLGEFADSFNTMVAQLREREEYLNLTTKRMAAKAEALEEVNSLLIHVMEHTRDWVVVQDAATEEVLFQNRPAEANASCGAPCTPGMVEKFNDGLLHLLPTLKTGEKPAVLKLCRKTLQVDSFSMDWRGHNAVVYIIADITRQRAEEKKMESYAYTDPLTGLNNRRFCMMKLEEMVRRGKDFTLCFADLDGLKFVNDVCGHREGDRYILAAAQALRQSFCSGELLCRVGGDEFVVLAEHCTEEVMHERMGQVSGLLQSNRTADGRPMGLSYGAVNSCCSQATNYEELLTLADQKMYMNKGQRKLYAQPEENIGT